MDKKKQKGEDQKQHEEQGVSQEEFEKLKNDFDSLQNQLKRAVADYQNLEKRITEGRSELSSWATADLIQRILPPLEHFDKALTGTSEEEKKSGWYRGVELALQQLKAVLKDEGLEEIAAAGQFDPALHEAVDVKEVPPSPEGSVEPKDNMILEVAEKGYTLNGKVLKPAKVIVGKKGEVSS